MSPGSGTSIGGRVKRKRIAWGIKFGGSSAELLTWYMARENYSDTTVRRMKRRIGTQACLNVLVSVLYKFITSTPLRTRRLLGLLRQSRIENEPRLMRDLEVKTVILSVYLLPKEITLYTFLLG